MARYQIDSETVHAEARTFAAARDSDPPVGAHFSRAAERIVAIVGTKDITDEQRVLAIRHTLVALGFANSGLEDDGDARTEADKTCDIQYDDEEVEAIPCCGGNCPQTCTCPLGPEDAHFPDCPMYSEADRG